MPLKLRIKDLAEVDEAHRTLYVEADGGGHMLDVEGLPDVSGYESALEKERRMSRKLTQQLKAYERDGQALSAEELKEQLAELEELRGQKDALGKTKDEQVHQMAEKLRKEFGVELDVLKARNAEIEQAKAEAEQRLRTYTIESTLEQTALSQRVRKEFLEDVKLRAGMFGVLPDDDVVEGQKVVMLDGSGNPQISTKGGGRYVTPTDWLEQMSRDKPAWFEPNTGGGSPGASTRGSGSRAVVARDDQAGIIGNLEAIADGKTAVQ